MTIGVIGTIKVKAGKEGEFEALMRELQTQVRAKEPGALQYDFFRSRKEPNTYVMMEQYASKDDLDAHGRTHHFAAVGTRLMACLESAPVVQILEKLS